MKIKAKAKKILLPNFVLTRLSDKDEPKARKVTLPSVNGSKKLEYYVLPKSTDEVDYIASSNQSNVLFQERRYKLFPVVLNSAGVPWREANEWLIQNITTKTSPNMASYHSIASDLAAFRHFIDDRAIDWLDFPPMRLKRPTYRFHGHLSQLIKAGEIASSTAKRRMSTVISFYKWLVSQGEFRPANPLWQDKLLFIGIKDRHGFSRLKHVITTDVSIKISKADDPYSDYLDDGGKLRPLPPNEQEWLMEALIHLGNTEMTLIHLFGMLTGARIQTVCTFQVGHVKKALPNGAKEVRIPVGPGTGVDTKNSKLATVIMPAWFYDRLRTYAFSERARNRRLRAIGGDIDDQYLFLSIRGAPFYESHVHRQSPNITNDLHHSKVGQGIRQFIKERVIPWVLKKYPEASRFKYRYHDMRATFGMNTLDVLLREVEAGRMTLRQVLDILRTLMWHESLTTTERYLNYRSRQKVVHAIQDDWENHLRMLADKAMKVRDVN